MPNHLSHRHLIILCISTIMIMSGCAGSTANQDTTDEWGTVTIPRGDTIRIAVTVAGNDSELATVGREQFRGVQLAAENYGEINGFSVELVQIDTLCSENSAILAAETLIDDPTIVAVIGPTCAEECAAVSSVYDTAHYTFISPSCGLSELVDPVTFTPVFFRTANDKHLEAVTAAEYAYVEIGARRAAMIHDGSDEGVTMTETFEAIFAAQGGKVIMTGVITGGNLDLSDTLSQLQESNPDIIYAPLQPSGAKIITISRAEAGISDIPLLGGSYFWTQSYINETTSSANVVYADAVYAVGSAYTGTAYDDLLVKYNVLFEEAPGNTAFALAYDAMNLILQGIEGTGLTQKNNLIIGRMGLADAIRETANYPGITGIITCTPQGDCSTGMVGVGQVRQDSWKVLYLP